MTNSSLDNDMVADALKFEEVDDLPAVTADAIKLVTNDGEDITYVHADHVGSPQKMTDKDRAIVWDAAYLPFGEEHSLTGSAANDNRFPGQRFESETGLHYNYYRDYDPSTGRYLQSDPIGLAGGINTYGYVSGNPLRYVDPRGLFCIPCAAPLIPIAEAMVGGTIGGGLGLLFSEMMNSPSETNNTAATNEAQQCKPDNSCHKDYARISARVSELKKRYFELVEDKMKLPAEGPMSVGGHIQQYRNKQANLRRMLREAEKKGCFNYQKDAWKWATKQPSP